VALRGRADRADRGVLVTVTRRQHDVLAAHAHEGGVAREQASARDATHEREQVVGDGIR
jgi:hypothetical protein